MLWHIGNTTVRTPYRLREGLVALQNSSLNGNLHGKEQEIAFAELLGNLGIVNTQDKKTLDLLGRKWRAALYQLGFITPKLTNKLPSGIVDPELAKIITGIPELSGRPFEITPNGYRLINSEIITAQQECFLRSLAAYRIPSILERDYSCKAFSPLKFTIQLLDELQKVGQESILSFQEFALFVQTSSPDDGIAIVSEKISKFREGRKQSAGNVRNYDNQFYKKVAAQADRKEETLDDYADLSLRYLKATGLFKGAGRGITLSPTRAYLSELLRQERDADISDVIYLQTLWKGASLPTDDVIQAYSIILDLIQRLKMRGVDVIAPTTNIPIAEIESLRHTLEKRLFQLDEEEFAKQQANCIDEIAAWMKILPSRGKAKLSTGEISIPKGEGPAYFEWVIWRAFLAINSLSNTPWESRRFQVDQDFLPVGTAPGGGPDMVFEFEDAIIVVEVTLTSSSRQEAAEGEPVRRHVAEYTERSEAAGGKPVYGLFIAVEIDSNTAHTFLSGNWYLRDDRKLSLDIVPIKLEDFAKFFLSGHNRLDKMPQLLKELLRDCRAKANQEAPQWKRSITTIVDRHCALKV